MGSRSALVLRVIYGVCLLSATYMHAAALWEHGLFWDYGGGIPQFTRVYWTSLAFLDPLAAIWLFVRPRIGLIGTLAIISSDVAHNLWFAGHYHVSFNWMLGAQCAFLVFVIASFRSLWRGLDSSASPRPPSELESV